MNSYAFGIVASWWWFILLILISTSFAYFSYRFTIPPISRTRKIQLIILRSLGIALLLFVLFEPVLTIVKGKEDTPKIAVLLDNSISAGLTDASGNRVEQFKNAVKNSNFMSLNQKESDVLIFDANPRAVEEYSEKSMNFKGQITDISKAIQEISRKSENENIRAVLLITDGAFNAGNNPLYDAELLGKPVYTVGIGDSIEPRDVSIQSVLTNDVVYVDNPVPVNINLKTSGYDKGDLTVKFYDNDTKISEQNFSILPERTAFTAVFEFNPKTDGVHRLKAEVNNLPNEITLKNNTKTEYVEVLKNKRKITIFAGSPSADVSFVRNALTEEKGVEVKTFVQKNNDDYYEGMPTDKDYKETEIFVLIGYPINSTNPAILKNIKAELERGKSILFVASRFINYNLSRLIEDYLPFTMTSSKQNEFLTTPDINPNALSNPLLRITGTQEDINLWNQLPPIYHTETFVNVKPESEILSTMKIKNVPLKEPLILSRSIRNRKSVAILGYDIYRWKLLGYASDIAQNTKDAHDIFTNFIQNSAKWLAVEVDNKLVSIKTSKNFYNTLEKVEFFAQIYDQSFNPIENAIVNLSIKGPSGDSKELILNTLGNGRYHGEIEGLPQGTYYFTGEAHNNGNKLGSDDGKFSVGETEVEYRNLTMNAPLLRSIADRTGGKFYSPESVAKFLEDLKKSGAFKFRGITVRSEIALWNLPWLIAMAILSFSIEWFLRKRAGML